MPRRRAALLAAVALVVLAGCAAVPAVDPGPDAGPSPPVAAADARAAALDAERAHLESRLSWWENVTSYGVAGPEAAGLSATVVGSTADGQWVRVSVPYYYTVETAEYTTTRDAVSAATYFVTGERTVRADCDARRTHPETETEGAALAVCNVAQEPRDVTVTVGDAPPRTVSLNASSGVLVVDGAGAAGDVTVTVSASGVETTHAVSVPEHGAVSVFVGPGDARLVTGDR
ncbi:MAG: hypothetical protein ABEJ88_10425 [Halobacterium sp.]